MPSARVDCAVCGYHRERSGCTAERCNASAGGLMWPWKRDMQGRLCEVHGNPIPSDAPYLVRTLPFLPELEALARVVQAAKTQGELRKLRTWVDALVTRLNEAQRPGEPGGDGGA